MIGSNYRRRESDHKHSLAWKGLRLLPPTSFPPNLTSNGFLRLNKPCQGKGILPPRYLAFCGPPLTEFSTPPCTTPQVNSKWKSPDISLHDLRFLLCPINSKQPKKTTRCPTARTSSHIGDSASTPNHMPRKNKKWNKLDQTTQIWLNM